MADTASIAPPPPPALTSPSTSKPFLFGAEWSFQPSQALRDRFFEAGFNMARVSGGGYDWTIKGHQDEISDLEKHGCKVILQLASHYPAAEYFKYTDSYLFDSTGATGTATRGGDWAVNYPGGAWPQYSYAGADVKAQMEVDYAKYLNALKDHSNIDSIMVHNEPGYFWANQVYDYNPQAIAKFRQWLATQYPTIDAMNAAWRMHYRSFDAVKTPTALPPSPNIACWLDWRRFQIALIEDYLKWEVGVSKASFPSVPVTTNLGGSLDHWFPYRAGDNYRYTDPMAIAGIDCYPGDPWTDRFYAGYTLDQTNGAALGETPGSAPPKPTYVLECETYSPQKFPGLTEDQRASMLRSEVWGFIGHGAKAVCLWSLGNRDEYNLTDGAWNARLATCRDIAYQAKMLNLGVFNRRRSHIAVVVDQDSLLYYGGTELSPGELTSTVAQDARGMYSAIAANHWQADVISEAQFVNGGWKQYGLVMLPSQVMMDDKLASTLTDFVRNGGTLIADAPFAQVDRHGWPISVALRANVGRLFGVKFGDTSPGGLDVHGSYTITGAFCRQAVTPTTAVVSGRFIDRKPALTLNRFGAGRAMFFATLVGNTGGDWKTWDGAPLSRWLQHVVRVHAKVLVGNDGDQYVEGNSLADQAGNTLLILDIPPQDGAAIDNARNVTGYAYSGINESDAQGASFLSRWAYVCAPTRISDGVVSSGPKRINCADSVGGWGATIPQLDGAAAVLFATDAPPLIALSAGAALGRGSDFDVTVTVYNPSPRRISGIVSLVLPDKCAQIGDSPTADIPAFGDATVILKSTSSGELGRMTVSATFTPTSGASLAPVSAIPIDIDAKELE